MTLLRASLRMSNSPMSKDNRARKHSINFKSLCIRIETTKPDNLHAFSKRIYLSVTSMCYRPLFVMQPSLTRVLKGDIL